MQRGQVIDDRLAMRSADASEHGPAHPSLSQQPIQAMQPPEREEMRRVPAADVEDILRRDKVSEIGRSRWLPRQRGWVAKGEVRCGAAVGERAIELRDVRRRIRAGRRNEAHA